MPSTQPKARNRRDLTERNLGPIKRHDKQIQELQKQVRILAAAVATLLRRAAGSERP